jgi:hypothetical protein
VSHLLDTARRTYVAGEDTTVRFKPSCARERSIHDRSAHVSPSDRPARVSTTACGSLRIGLGRSPGRGWFRHAEATPDTG